MLLQVLVTAYLLIGLLPSPTQQAHPCSLSQVHQVRLAGGSSYGGVVEICHSLYTIGLTSYNFWLPACNLYDSWDSTVAAAICQILNFSTTQPHEFQAFTITNLIEVVSPRHIVHGVVITCNGPLSRLTCSYTYHRNCIVNGVFIFGAVLCKFPSSNTTTRVPNRSNTTDTLQETNENSTDFQEKNSQEILQNSTNLTTIPSIQGNSTGPNVKNSSRYEEQERDSCTVIVGILSGVVCVAISFAVLLAILSMSLCYKKTTITTKPKDSHKGFQAYTSRKKCTSQRRTSISHQEVQTSNHSKKTVTESEATESTKGIYEREEDCFFDDGVIPSGKYESQYSEVTKSTKDPYQSDMESYYDDVETPTREYALYSDLETLQEYGMLETYDHNEKMVYDSQSQSGQYNLLHDKGALPKPDKDDDYCKLNYR